MSSCAAIFTRYPVANVPIVAHVINHLRRRLPSTAAFPYHLTRLCCILINIGTQPSTDPPYHPPLNWHALLPFPRRRITTRPAHRIETNIRIFIYIYIYINSTKPSPYNPPPTKELQHQPARPLALRHPDPHNHNVDPIRGATYTRDGGGRLDHHAGVADGEAARIAADDARIHPRHVGRVRTGVHGGDCVARV